MKKTCKKWVGVLYAAVLVVLAAAGIVYCLMLKGDLDAASTQNQYAIEKDSGLNLNADAEDTITLDEIDIPAGAVEDDTE